MEKKGWERRRERGGEKKGNVMSPGENSLQNTLAACAHKNELRCYAVCDNSHVYHDAVNRLVQTMVQTKTIDEQLSLLHCVWTPKRHNPKRSPCFHIADR